MRPRDRIIAELDRASRPRPEWTFRRGARLAGMTVEAYRERIAGGEKRCLYCQEWHPVSEFGVDRSRGDGFTHSCLRSVSVRLKARRNARPKRPWARPLVHHCTVCGAEGHNRRTCPGEDVAKAG